MTPELEKEKKAQRGGYKRMKEWMETGRYWLCSNLFLFAVEPSIRWSGRPEVTQTSAWDCVGSSNFSGQLNVNWAFALCKKCSTFQMCLHSCHYSHIKVICGVRCLFACCCQGECVNHRWILKHHQQKCLLKMLVCVLDGQVIPGECNAKRQLKRKDSQNKYFGDYHLL